VFLILVSVLFLHPRWENILIWDPGSEINILDFISKSFVTVFELKIVKFFVVDPDSGSGTFLTLEPGWKIRIRDKHDGSATLVYVYFCSGVPGPFFWLSGSFGFLLTISTSLLFLLKLTSICLVVFPD
jgi:hypothetical protein